MVQMGGRTNLLVLFFYVREHETHIVVKTSEAGIFAFPEYFQASVDANACPRLHQLFTSE